MKQSISFQVICLTSPCLLRGIAAIIIIILMIIVISLFWFHRLKKAFLDINCFCYVFHFSWDVNWIFCQPSHALCNSPLSGTRSTKFWVLLVGWQALFSRASAVRVYSQRRVTSSRYSWHWGLIRSPQIPFVHTLLVGSINGFPSSSARP